MQKTLYANYIITLMSFIIWAQLFGNSHLSVSIGTFIGLFYLNLVFSKWLLKCPKCKNYILKHLEVITIRTLKGKINKTSILNFAIYALRD